MFELSDDKLLKELKTNNTLLRIVINLLVANGATIARGDERALHRLMQTHTDIFKKYGLEVMEECSD